MVQIPVLAKLLSPTEKDKKLQQYKKKRKTWHMKKQSRRAINKEPLAPSLKACRKVSQEETTDDL